MEHSFQTTLFVAMWLVMLNILKFHIRKLLKMIRKLMQYKSNASTPITPVLLMLLTNENWNRKEIEKAIPLTIPSILKCLRIYLTMMYKNSVLKITKHENVKKSEISGYIYVRVYIYAYICMLMVSIFLV